MKSISRLNICFFIITVGVISCTQKSGHESRNPGIDTLKPQTLYLNSSLEGFYKEGDYVFCDTTIKDEMNCFLNYEDRRYLKKQKIFYDDRGQIKKILLYKPEGVLGYSFNDLVADSILVKTNNWRLKDNILKIEGDSVLYPIQGKIEKFNSVEKKVYCLLGKNKNELYVFEVWK